MLYDDDDFDSDEDYDDDYGDPYDDDTSVDTFPCSNCGKDIYEDAVQCPYCGEYVMRSSSSPFAGKPAWWVALGVFGVIIMVLMLLIG